MLGFFIVLGLVVAAAVLVITSGGDGDRELEALGPVTTIFAVTDNADDDAAEHDRTVPDAPDDAGPAGTTELVTLSLTMDAGDERFCGDVDLTIGYDAVDTATVVITDDAGQTLFDGEWVADATHGIEVDAPSTTLFAELTARVDEPDEFRPSGSVSGKLCRGLPDRSGVSGEP